MKYKDFADQIIEMRNADLAFRDKLIKSGELSNGYNAEMEKIHNDNSVKLNPNKYDDLDKVNQRRESVGLKTIEQQTEIIRQQTFAENQFPPEDFQKRKMQYEEWRKRVGWTQ